MLNYTIARAEHHEPCEVQVPLDTFILHGRFDWSVNAADYVLDECHMQSDSGQIIYLDDPESHGVYRQFGEGGVWHTYAQLLAVAFEGR